MIVESDVNHETGAFATTLPDASRTVAVSCEVAPACADSVPVIAMVFCDAGVPVTVTVLLPDLPPVLAVIVAVPAPTAVTRPFSFTVATAVFELDQVNVRPVIV
jgi:hypothetical protein